LAPDHAGVIVSWAADAAGLFAGTIEPRCITRSIQQSWAPDCNDVDFVVQVLWPYFHPLRHPEQCLRRYRRAFAAL
jgi:hypothetical protein